MASQITSVSIVCPKRLFRRRSKKTSKLRVTGLCEGNSPVTGEFFAQRDSNAENVSIWWRHHDFWCWGWNITEQSWGTWSLPSLLMSGLLASPGHQQLWYWLAMQDKQVLIFLEDIKLQFCDVSPYWSLAISLVHPDEAHIGLLCCNFDYIRYTFPSLKYINNIIILLDTIVDKLVSNHEQNQSNL